jgi:uracil-DNA glycosylase
LPRARCAPPDNKPTPAELARCRPHLEAEWAAAPTVSVVVCLGRIAYDICWRILDARGLETAEAAAAFVHGQVVSIPGGPRCIAAYHPSRQNTQHGPADADRMLLVFATARSLIEG